MDCVMPESSRGIAKGLPGVADRVAVAATLSARLLARGGAQWPIPAIGPAPNRARFRALRRAIRAFDRISTPSRFIVEEYARQGMPLPSDRTCVLPLGVDRSQFESSRLIEDLPVRPERPLRVGFVGQLLYHKGPHTLLEALRLLPNLPIEVELHGMRWPDHDYDERLRSLFDREPRAHYRGRFPDELRPRVLASFDVLAIPSAGLESFGIATREAFLAGRPVLSTDRGALPESVRSGVDGLLVPADDPPAMAAALRRLVEEPELLPRLAAGARRAGDAVKSMDAYAAEIETELYARSGVRSSGEIRSNAST